jgi:hypothetical protein
MSYLFMLLSYIRLSSEPDIEFTSNLHSKLHDICFVLLSIKQVIYKYKNCCVIQLGKEIS